MTDKDILNAINKIIIYYGNLIKFRKSEDIDTAAYGVIAAISALADMREENKTDDR